MTAGCKKKSGICKEGFRGKVDASALSAGGRRDLRERGLA